jgi:hypothetical protein
MRSRRLLRYTVNLARKGGCRCADGETAGFSWKQRSTRAGLATGHRGRAVGVEDVPPPRGRHPAVRTVWPRPDARNTLTTSADEEAGPPSVATAGSDASTSRSVDRVDCH